MKQYYADVAQLALGAEPQNGSVLTAITRAIDGPRSRGSGQARRRAHSGQRHERRVEHNFKLPAAVGGTGHVERQQRRIPVGVRVLLQYDAEKKSQVPTGDTLRVEGKTGVRRLSPAAAGKSQLRRNNSCCRSDVFVGQIGRQTVTSRQPVARTYNNAVNDKPS